jgi:prepilin-type N-terminal cleavage/methylation domain-containing protein
MKSQRVLRPRRWTDPRIVAQYGFTILEVVITTSLIGVGIAAITSVTQFFISNSRTMAAQRMIASYRGVLVDTLNSYSGWRATVLSGTATPSPGTQAFPDNGPELSCLRSGASSGACITSTAMNTPQLIGVVNGDNDLVFDSKNPTHGFRHDGRYCTGFVQPPGVGTDACPFRYDVAVRLICPEPLTPETCQNPEVLLSGRLIHNGSPDARKINVDRFAFSFVRGLDRNTVRAACETAGGTYTRDPFTNDESCRLPFAGDCPLGFVVAGINLEPEYLNMKLCRPVIGRCPDGQLMTGLNQNGMPICSSGICSIPAPPPIPPPPPIVLESVIYSDGGSTDGGCGPSGGPDSGGSDPCGSGGSW